MKIYKEYQIYFCLVLIIQLFCINNLISADKYNPYNLNIVSDYTTYNNSIKSSPNNELINLESMIPYIKLDIKYATSDNFTKKKVYTLPKAYLRKEAADSLIKVQNELNKKGLGLKIFDAYRPYQITLKFYEIYPDTNFVAAPWKGSKHNYGCAVDLTIIDMKTGKEIEMPTAFDDFTDKASQNATDITPIAKINRDLLRNVMKKYGFNQYDPEWWHYDFYNWKNYKIMDLSFEELD